MPEKAIRYDNEKPRMDLIDPDFLEGLAKVLTFGARKYSPNNWRNGFYYSRVISSIYRHLIAFQRGEDCDPESGESHLYHLGCNVMFLAGIQKEFPELDDRYKGKQNVLSTPPVSVPGSGDASDNHSRTIQTGQQVSQNIRHCHYSGTKLCAWPSACECAADERQG